MQNVRLSLGNVIIIGGISALTCVTAMAAVHVLSNKDVPFLSPTARGFSDFYKRMAA